MIASPLIVALAALLAAAPEEVPFEPSSERFADAAACRAHLGTLVARARGDEHEAVEGPYDIAAGDVRAHVVDIAGGGHRITEHRCFGGELSARSWRHSMGSGEEEEPETVESMAAKAEWLKKQPAKQQ